MRKHTHARPKRFRLRQVLHGRLSDYLAGRKTFKYTQKTIEGRVLIAGAEMTPQLASRLNDYLYPHYHWERERTDESRTEPANA